MTAEITAQELAAKAVDMFGEGERVESWLTGAQEFLILTRAHAALQAPPTEAPGRVRCWHVDGIGIFDEEERAKKWRSICEITPGWFTPDTEAHE